jgi:hypothetical protein
VRCVAGVLKLQRLFSSTIEELPHIVLLLIGLLLDNFALEAPFNAHVSECLLRQQHISRLEMRKQICIVSSQLLSTV